MPTPTALVAVDVGTTSSLVDGLIGALIGAAIGGAATSEPAGGRLAASSTTNADWPAPPPRTNVELLARP